MQKIIVEKDKEILELKKIHIGELRAFTQRIDDLELENRSKELEIESLSKVRPKSSTQDNQEYLDDQFEDDQEYGDFENEPGELRGKAKQRKSKVGKDG